MILNAPTSNAPESTAKAPSAGSSPHAKPSDAPSNILGYEEYRLGVEAKAKPDENEDRPETGIAPARRAKPAGILSRAEQRAEDKAAGVYGGRIVWIFCFCSFLGLQLNEKYGMPAAALFLAPWMLMILWRIPRMAEFVLKDWLVLVSPSFATLSALWSSDPPWTMRAGIQYGATVIVGVAAARLVNRRIVLTSMMTALTVVMIGSFIVTIRSLGIHAIHGMTGLYGSKNQFASSSAIVLVGAIYLVIHSHHSKLQRLAGIGLTGLALLGIYGGHSAGTIISIATVGMAAVGFRLMRNYGKAAILLLTPVFFVIPVFLVLADTSSLFGRILQLFGKDRTLTGRTDLWAVAFQQVELRMLLGKGYQAFWRIDNPVAEKLWAIFGIATRTGFNFHNEYLNTAVDLGLVGLIINVTLLICVASQSIKIRLTEKETLLTAIHSVFLFYLILTFVEQEFFYQFFLSPVILCLTWADRSRLRSTAPAKMAG